MLTLVQSAIEDSQIGDDSRTHEILFRLMDSSWSGTHVKQHMHAKVGSLGLERHVKILNNMLILEDVHVYPRV